MQNADIFSQVPPKHRPRGEGETLPAMLATTESDSSTSLLIDLAEFTQRQFLPEPDEPCCCGNLRESYILGRLVDGPRREERIKPYEINTLGLRERFQ